MADEMSQRDSGLLNEALDIITGTAYYVDREWDYDFAISRSVSALRAALRGDEWGA